MNSNILDPNIRDIVISLNSLGHKTDFSCAGAHKEIPKWEQDPRGYISLPGRHRIKTLCGLLGLKRIKVKYPNFHGSTIVTFTGLGGPSYDWNLSGRPWDRSWINKNPTEREALEYHLNRVHGGKKGINV